MTLMASWGLGCGCWLFNHASHGSLGGWMYHRHFKSPHAPIGDGHFGYAHGRQVERSGCAPGQDHSLCWELDRPQYVHPTIGITQTEADTVAATEIAHRAVADADLAKEMGTASRNGSQRQGPGGSRVSGHRSGSKAGRSCCGGCRSPHQARCLGGGKSSRRTAETPQSLCGHRSWHRCAHRSRCSSPWQSTTAAAAAAAAHAATAHAATGSSATARAATVRAIAAADNHGIKRYRTSIQSNSYYRMRCCRKLGQ